MKRFILLSCLLLLAVGTLWSQDSVNVTFNVNMKVAILKGDFNPTTQQVTIPGGFNSWLGEPPANSTKTMTDTAPVDSIYTKVIRIAKATNYEYKFNIGLGWDGKDEPSNRAIKVWNADTSVTYWFKNQAMPSGDSANVTFRVNMMLPMKENANFAGTRKVFVAGSFWTGSATWSDGPVEMTDSNNDSIYIATVRTPSAQLLKFKFIHSTTTAAAGSWESIADRTHWVVDGADTTAKNWEDKDPFVTLASGNILFTIDMSVLAEVGLYDATKDSIRVYGQFNGWNAGGPSNTWKMGQDVITPTTWALNVPFVNTAINSAYGFKYFIDIDTTGGRLTTWTDGWERPVSQGGGNRDVTYLGQAGQELAVVYYDDIHPDWVIPNNTNVTAKFTVNMKDAAKMNAGTFFTPGTDKVYWICEMPSFVISQGWLDSDTMKVLELTDANADSVYEGTLSVADPTFNVFQYRYAIRKPDASWTQETGGFGDNAYRVRYVGQSAARTFPNKSWVMPTDAWDDNEKPQEVNPFQSLTLVPNEGLVATTYELGQNYPNPFNPMTNIRFTISSTELVTLKVFNVLGQEVATLVNEDLAAGVYTAKFDASNLVSGVYFYRIAAGEFSEVKRMVFLK